MLDHDKVIDAFRQALEELGLLEKEEDDDTIAVRPRAVALRAHKIYCARLKPHEKHPVSETFRKYATGQLDFPEVVALLENANIRPLVRARLDRTRLRVVFEEAIQRLETRLLRGQAKPLQIARRAYEIYTRGSSESSKAGGQPSHYTFERLIYGKAADPEIVTLIDAAITKTKSKREDELS